MAITYRQLAVNAEENHRYREASRFRYNAFEVQRVEKLNGLVPWRLDWWYWLASGYGESVGRAFVMFIVLIGLFAFGYTKVGFQQEDKISTPVINISAQNQVDSTKKTQDAKGKPLGKFEALIYSAYVTVNY
ncbi:MAG: hypothetical protein L0226_00920 [Acidobacteria bacterium]|nr:hypothetical protein [Acidobacteriota bacterium]